MLKISVHHSHRDFADLEQLKRLKCERNLRIIWFYFKISTDFKWFVLDSIVKIELRYLISLEMPHSLSSNI